MITIIEKYHILLTNDDGIESPGLWAAAEALSELGFVHVTAPRDQYSGAGRSLPSNTDGSINPRTVTINDKEWTVYAVGGSPAQTVLHGVLQVTPRKPDLVVSGINYGENVGTIVTISGTVGAALEAASLGIPALAVSLETDPADYRSYSTAVDFSAAAHFTVLFARMLLEKKLLPDVDVLKVEVPIQATPATAWEIVRLSRENYYQPITTMRTSPNTNAYARYTRLKDPQSQPGTDAYTLRDKQLVAVTPLSLDLTSRVDFQTLDKMLRDQ